METGPQHLDIAPAHILPSTTYRTAKHAPTPSHEDMLPTGHILEEPVKLLVDCATFQAVGEGLGHGPGQSTFAFNAAVGKMDPVVRRLPNIDMYRPFSQSRKPLRIGGPPPLYVVRTPQGRHLDTLSLRHVLRHALASNYWEPPEYQGTGNAVMSLLAEVTNECLRDLLPKEAPLPTLPATLFQDHAPQGPHAPLLETLIIDDEPRHFITARSIGETLVQQDAINRSQLSSFNLFMQGFVATLTPDGETHRPDISGAPLTVAEGIVATAGLSREAVALKRQWHVDPHRFTGAIQDLKALPKSKRPKGYGPVIGGFIDHYLQLLGPLMHRDQHTA